MSEIEAAVKDFILTEFLAGTHESELTLTTPLITGGILDSLATLRMVAFLEEQYGVEIAPHEASVDHMNTISDIAALVRAKR